MVAGPKQQPVGAYSNSIRNANNTQTLNEQGAGRYSLSILLLQHSRSSDRLRQVSWIPQEKGSKSLLTAPSFSGTSMEVRAPCLANVTAGEMFS